MTYKHTVQYYETDQMGVVHHSNYIRWFEEARTYFLSEAGIPYHEMEKQGIISPVIRVECKYISMARFGETAEIAVRLTDVGNVRFSFEYTVSVNGNVKAKGKTEHCFINKEGTPISLKRERPEMFEILKNSLFCNICTCKTL